MLHGYNLRRFKYGIKDFDIILNNRLNHKTELKDSKNISSGSDFDISGKIENSTCDIIYKNNQEYKNVTYMGVNFKVQPLLEILKYKIEYALKKNKSSQCNNSIKKHHSDMLEILNKI